MSPFQPQYCYCSLRDGVEHTVRNRSDWNRHVRQKRDDILDQEDTGVLPVTSGNLEPLCRSQILESCSQTGTQFWDLGVRFFLEGGVDPPSQILDLYSFFSDSV